jgi:predicted secreted protein
MLIVLGCGCAGANAVTVRLTEEDSSATAILHVGDRLRVELPNHPFAALRWALTTLDASHLEVLSKRDRPLASGFFAPSTEVFVWKAVSPGHADIRLELSRRGGDQVLPPAKQMSISVEIVPGELTPMGANDSDLLDSALQATATYKGTLPCRDCVGIAVELTLYTKSQPTKYPKPGAPHFQKGDKVTPTVFVERRRYLGAPGGDRTIVGTGRINVQYSTYADPSMTVYMLVSPEGTTENFQVAGDRLVLLDAQMLPIPASSGQSIMLEKVPEAASQP